jgi:5'-nucleotidase
VRVLLTNDDGIDSPGLLALSRRLAEVAEVAVVAPADNQSAVGRGITLRRDLDVDERQVPGATVAFAVTGTPVDCVRIAVLGLAGERPDAVVSGANLGLNLGDDVTYSGTVAAAIEGLLLGLPAIAVSQQSQEGELGFVGEGGWVFEPGARFVARLLARMAERGFPTDTLLNVNVPGAVTAGARAARLGRRIYRDELLLVGEEGGRRRYRLYGGEGSYHQEPGSDFEAVVDGAIAVTPLHFDLAVPSELQALRDLDLGRLLEDGTA